MDKLERGRESSLTYIHTHKKSMVQQVLELGSKFRSSVVLFYFFASHADV